MQDWLQNISLALFSEQKQMDATTRPPVLEVTEPEAVLMADAMQKRAPLTRRFEVSGISTLRFQYLDQVWSFRWFYGGTPWAHTFELVNESRGFTEVFLDGPARDTMIYAAQQKMNDYLNELLDEKFPLCKEEEG